MSLNPYSNGTTSLTELYRILLGLLESLNPYSNGTTSLTAKFLNLYIPNLYLRNSYTSTL